MIICRDQKVVEVLMAMSVSVVDFDIEENDLIAVILISG